MIRFKEKQKKKKMEALAKKKALQTKDLKEHHFSRRVDQTFKAGCAADASKQHEKWIYDLVELLSFAKLVDVNTHDKTDVAVYAPTETIKPEQMVVPLIGVVQKQLVK